jgi:hypothetical protein
VSYTTLGSRLFSGEQNGGQYADVQYASGKFRHWDCDLSTAFVPLQQGRYQLTLEATIYFQDAETKEFSKPVKLIAEQISFDVSELNATTNAIQDIKSSDERIRDRGVDSILNDRKATIEQLISLVDVEKAEKQDEKTRIAAVYLLGDLRAVEAVPVLSKALSESLDDGATLDISRYDVPAFTALVKIGRPAVPAMIKNVETSDSQVLRTSSLDVLVHVLGGKRRLLELLAKLLEPSLEDQPANRDVARRIKDAYEWSESHYQYTRGTEEPLY